MANFIPAFLVKHRLIRQPRGLTCAFTVSLASAQPSVLDHLLLEQFASDREKDHVTSAIHSGFLIQAYKASGASSFFFFLETSDFQALLSVASCLYQLNY